MRQAADSLLEHEVNIVTRHRPLEILGGGNSIRGQAFYQATFQELDSLESAVGLAGQDHGRVLELTLAGLERAVAKIGHHENAARDQGDREQQTANDEEVCRAKATLGRRRIGSDIPRLGNRRIAARVPSDRPPRPHDSL